MRGIRRVDSIAGMNLASLDLNLLVGLDALLRHRSVTRAAEEVGLSQPALSAVLARLRRHFGDELLTRVGNQYRLTPLAVRLKDRVAIALSDVERVFTAQADFDPAETTREFSLAISDYGIVVFGSAVAATLAAEAPKARLRLVPNVPQFVDNAEQMLLSTDLLLIPHGFLHDLPNRDLYRDEWVCVVSADNPDIGAELTIEQLAVMPWVVSYHGPTASTPAARQLRTLGVEPHVQVVTENFLTVPALVAGTGRVALLQRGLVDAMPGWAGVRALPCPFAADPLVEAMWWHPMHGDSPEHAYLRDVVVRATAHLRG